MNIKKFKSVAVAIYTYKLLKKLAADDDRSAGMQITFNALSLINGGVLYHTTGNWNLMVSLNLTVRGTKFCTGIIKF